MGKVIFLDLDGTIRDFDGTIPVSGIEAIQKARQNGHEVVLSTGRAYFRISRQILDIGFDGVIASSGGYVEYKDERIGYRYFTQLAYIELMKDLVQRRCVVEMENNKASYVLRDSWADYQELAVYEKLYGEEEERLMPIPVESLLDVPEVQRLVVFSSSITKRDILSKWGYSFHITNFGFPYEEKWAGEITPNYTTKAEGVRRIMKLNERSREDIIVVGSSENDVEMLAVAGTGIAMGNGTQEAKEAADYVTASLKEDGLWKAFEREGLLG